MIVVFFIGFPQVAVRQALGPADKGIPYLVNSDEGEYLSRIHEILDGYGSVASPVLYEYKNSPTIMPPVGEFLFYALPVKLTGFSLQTIIYLGKFALPALLFFFAYLFILSLFNRDDGGARISATAGALLITLGYDAYDLRNFIGNILQGTSNSSGFLWSRLVNPITGGILLFAFLWLFSRIVQGKGKWSTVIFSGLILSATSGYIFSFGLGLSIAVIMGLYFVWRKNWPMVLKSYVPVMIALVINGLYFINVLLVMRGGSSLSDPLRSGMFLTNEPLINMISLASLLGAIFCFVVFYRKDTVGEADKRWWFLILSVLSACELVYNQQIITGRTVWPQHFVQYTTPLSMSVLIVLLHNILRANYSNLWRISVFIILFGAVLFGWRGFEAASQNTIPKYTELQSFAGVFDYFNTHATKDCVVYVSSDYANEINRFIPGFTGCNVYYSFYIYSGVPPERIMHNYLVNLRLRGVKLKDVREHFLGGENIFYTKSYFFRDWNDLFCCQDKWLAKIGDEDEINQWLNIKEKEVEEKYAGYLRGDLYSQLTRYRLDYFVVDVTRQPQVNEKNFPFLSFLGKFDRFMIYEVVGP